MDTKQKKRRPAPGRSQTASRTRSIRRSAPGREDRRTRTAATRSQSAQRKRSNRVVRPPKEEIPEVVYTMPKPFHRSNFLLKLVTVVAVVAALAGCVSLFFKVDTVMVAGVEKYSENQVLEASGIEYGTSLLGLSKSTTVSRIRYNLPYVDEVKIGIKLPGTVIIEVTEAEGVYAVRTVEDAWWLISSSGRAVEHIAPEEAENYPQILGFQIAVPETDQSIQAAVTEPVVQTTATAVPTETSEPAVTIPVDEDSQEKLAAALTIVKSLEENGGVGQMICLDVSDLSGITMEYQKRFVVDLGENDQLDYKIRFTISAVAQLIREGYDGGTLDMSLRQSQSPVFAPET